MQDTDDLHRRLLLTSLWIQQARCLSQPWCRRVCHLTWKTTISVEHTSKEQWINSFTSNQSVCWTTQRSIVLQSKSRCEQGNAGRLWLFVGWRWIQTHRHSYFKRSSERHGWTLGVRDSNLRSGSMMKTKTMSTPRRRLPDATPVWSDGSRRTEFDSEQVWRNRVKIRWPKTGWILLKQRNTWPVV